MEIAADVAVIGGGMAGLVAGTVASQAGLSVVVLSRGHGATADSSGAIDVIGYLPLATTPTVSAIEGLHLLAALHVLHPYSVLGLERESLVVDGDVVVKRVQETIEWFLSTVAESELRHVGSLDSTIMACSPLGTLKPTALLQQTMWSDSLMDEDNVVMFAGIRGYPDFHSGMAAKTFLEERQALREGPRRVINCTVDLSNLLPVSNLSAVELARLFDTEEGLRHLAESLQSHVEGTGASHVVLPPVLGLEHAATARSELESRLGAEVIETISFPPSIPGTRLQAALEAALERAGGRLLKGHEVVGTETSKDRVTGIKARGPRRSVSVTAKSYVLATGKFVGGGLAGDERGLRETVFGLQVFDGDRMSVTETRPQKLTDLTWVTERGHRLYTCGIGVDERLRPVGLDGRVYAANLFGAGAVLAGYNYITEKSGLGVAIATGHAAAIEAVNFATEAKS
ncbi:MAG: anaerobic glycerol-3-phosphate dehydrogenase subunit GlpB [Candidatus Thorarchaeota archaeon]